MNIKYTLCSYLDYSGIQFTRKNHYNWIVFNCAHFSNRVFL